MAKNPASVSLMLQDLKNGNEEASYEIWKRYMGDLIALSQRKLSKSYSKRYNDEEDIAITAFNAFLMGVRTNRFEKLFNRDDLWQVLVMLTERKAVDQIRRQKSQKRGSGKVRGESVFAEPDGNQNGISSLSDHQPTPEFAAQFKEEVQNNLLKLKDKELDKIVLLKLEGYSNSEIAQRMDLSISTIERKLRIIRQIWSK